VSSLPEQKSAEAVDAYNKEQAIINHKKTKLKRVYDRKMDAAQQTMKVAIEMHAKHEDELAKLHIFCMTFR
jgi:hypothetical protein